MPPTYVPVFYDQTQYYPGYATPTYYPQDFSGGRRFGPGYYNMGPSAAYISRVTGRNQADINQTITQNSTNITRIHNVVPPSGVIDRHAYLRQIIPPALAQGQRLPPPRLAPNAKVARVNLNRPNFVPAPKNVPRITATIPRVQPAARQPGRGLPGTALPTKATMPLTPQMTQQIQKLPPKQQFVPGKSQPFTPAAATQPGPGQPATPAKPGQAIVARPDLDRCSLGTQTKPGTGSTRAAQTNRGRSNQAPRPNRARCNPVARQPVRSNRENSTRVSGLGRQPPRLLQRPRSPASPPASPKRNPRHRLRTGPRHHLR